MIIVAAPFCGFVSFLYKYKINLGNLLETL